MTLEELKKFREKVMDVQFTMMGDCDYIKQDIKKHEEKILLDEKDFCHKVKEYTDLMPTYSQIKFIELKDCPVIEYFKYCSYACDSLRKLVIKVESEHIPELKVRIDNFYDDRPRIEIWFWHEYDGRKYHTILRVDPDELAWNNQTLIRDEEYKSARMFVMENQTEILEMIGKLVEKVNEKYIELLTRYNKDLLVKAEKYSK